MSTLQRAQANIARWRKSPLQFVREELHAEPDEWQRDALIALETGDRRRFRLCLKACTGPGKSTLLAWIGWWRLACFAAPGEHPKGAALSITADNLKDNLWAELAKWQGRSEWLKAAFTWTKERIYCNDHQETWFLSARSFAKDADAEAIGRALSGLHSKFPFILLDETGDMPTAVGRAAEQIFTGDPIDALIAQAGNPTTTSGLLYLASTTLRSQWHVITITADPDDPKRTPRVAVDLAREQIRLYGRDNAWVKATILGEFPDGGFNALLTLSEVEAAMGRHLTKDKYSFSQKRLGCDVARFGDDRTVIFGRQGLRATHPVTLRGADTMAVAGRLVQAKKKFNSELEFVDGTGGYGAGVIDVMVSYGFGPIEVQFGGKAQDDRYFNTRSEMWFRLADWVKAGGALPPIPELIRELTQPTYSFQGGKFRLEEKDQIKKRLGFSPDLGDALALTFFLPDMPRSAAEILAEQGVVLDGAVGKMASEWDPMDPSRA